MVAQLAIHAGFDVGQRKFPCRHGLHPAIFFAATHGPALPASNRIAG